MKSDLEPYHRRSIRLAGYDYTQGGAYFVTVCAFNKKRVFGGIGDGAMKSNVYGEIVSDCWCALPAHFSYVGLDESVVMPNHFHGILVFANDDIGGVGARHASPLHVCGASAGSLGSVVGSFKSAVTRRINAHRVERGWPIVKVWQRNFYERIIRNERELDDTRRYIADNPAHWLDDENFV